MLLVNVTISNFPKELVNFPNNHKFPRPDEQDPSCEHSTRPCSQWHDVQESGLHVSPSLRGNPSNVHPPASARKIQAKPSQASRLNHDSLLSTRGQSTYILWKKIVTSGL
jgi:hypothetical protein